MAGQISSLSPNCNSPSRGNTTMEGSQEGCVDLLIEGIHLGSLQELTISFLDPSIHFSNAQQYPYPIPSSPHLHTIILQQVSGCEAIPTILSDSHICPKLTTVVLDNLKPHSTCWPSLVEMVRVRDQDPLSSDIHSIHLLCHPQESPEPAQLAELRMHVGLV